MCQGTKPKAYFHEDTMKFSLTSKFLVDTYRNILIHQYRPSKYCPLISIKEYTCMLSDLEMRGSERLAATVPLYALSR